jgi:hypothetical protein
MQSFESFSRSIIPVYPVEEYLKWHSQQNPDFFNLNFDMWRELYKENINQLLAIIGDRMDGDDPEKPMTNEFLRLSFIVTSYHRFLDSQAREEIEQIIGGLDDTP